VKNLGKRWGNAVQELATKEGAALARATVKSAKYSADKSKSGVEVLVTMTLHMVFPKKGRGLDTDRVAIMCNCSETSYPDGSSVCVCIGPDAATCDCLIVA
jgi:hypothetical protein